MKKIIIQGYNLDNERMKNVFFLNNDYFQYLLEEIREIRLSERKFYQKITDIYATSFDYDKNSSLTIKLFKKIINKMHSTFEEPDDLKLIISSFLDLAENRAKRHIPMTMEDWSTRIDKFLLADDRDILENAGKISHEIACDKALT